MRRVSWSELPQELLASIGKHLDSNTIDTLHFRSVCHTWRSSIPHPERSPSFPLHLSFFVENPLPFITEFVITKTTIYRLQSASESLQAGNTSWLIKVRQSNSGDKMHLVNPFSKLRIQNLPNYFPMTINTLNFHVKEVHSFINLQRSNGVNAYDLFDDEARLHKVVLASEPQSNNNYLLGIKGCDLCWMHIGDNRWNLLDEQYAYRDIIYFSKIFFAVDMFGFVSMVDPSTGDLTLIDPPPGISKGEMYFVESCGDLFLVARDLTICDHLVYFDEDHSRYVREPDSDDIPVKFDVYKLANVENNDNGEQSRRHNWCVVNDLGDKVFCLSRDCSFSVIAQDFGLRGNYIFFVDDIEYDDDFGDDNNEVVDEMEEEREEEEGEEGLSDTDIHVYNLEYNFNAPLASYPTFPNFFWPPPRWLSD